MWSAIALVSLFTDTFLQDGSSVIRTKLALILPAITPPKR